MIPPHSIKPAPTRYSFMRYLLWVLMLILPLGLSGQSIERGMVDTDYLEALLKERIDSLRAQKGLEALARDSALDLAAENHATYILETGNIGHIQEEHPQMRTPRKRILHFGNYYQITAENVIQSYLFIPVLSSFRGKYLTELTDYHAVAAELAEGWRNSPGHYHNIVLPELNVTGMAVSYDNFTHEVFAVQTFGMSKNPPPVQDIKPVPPPVSQGGYGRFHPSPIHKRHAWRIKELPEDYRMKPYRRFKEHYISGNIRMYRSKDSIFLYHSKPNYLRRFFRKRKDGLALEFVPYSDYMDSSTYYTRPARRNGACLFNGIVPPPVYKQDIHDSIRYHQRNKRKNEPFFLYLGRVPEKLRGKAFEINMLVLKENYLLDVIHFADYPGKPMPFTLDVKKMPYQFKVRDEDYPVAPDYDTLFYKVFFSPNEVHPHDSIIRKIREMVHVPGYHPHYGIITAFASVEGPEAHNHELHPARAAFLSGLIMEEYPDSFPLYIHSRENWKMFRSQIQHTRYAFLADTSIEVARRVLKFDQAKKDLGPALDQQRFVNLYIIYEENITDLLRVNRAIEEFNKKVREIQTHLKEKRIRKPNPRMVDYLSDVEHFIFSEMLKGTIPISRSDSMDFKFSLKKKNKDPFIQETLLRDWVSFMIFYDKNVSIHLLSFGYPFIDMHNGHPVERLNYYIRVVNPEERERYFFPVDMDLNQLVSLYRLLDEFEDKDEHPSIRKMRHYYHLQRLNMARSKSPVIDPKKFRSNAEYVFEHYEEFTFTETIEDYKYRIALLLAHVEAFDLSLQLLEELYREGTNKAAIRDYLVIYYNSSMERNSRRIDLIFDAEDKLSDEEWCNLFRGNARISFQLLDNLDLREYYCKKCQ